MNITINDGRKEFYQWDINQKLSLENMPADSKIHFARSGDDEAVVVEIQRVNDAYTANVPNFLLQTEGIFYAYVYEKNNEREDTVYKKSFRVNGREKPASYIYKETELFTFEQIKRDLLDEIDSVKKDVNNKADGLKYEENRLSLMTGDEVISSVEIETSSAEISDNDLLRQMIENDFVAPIFQSDNAIFTDSTGKIYIY